MIPMSKHTYCQVKSTTVNIPISSLVFRLRICCPYGPAQLTWTDIICEKILFSELIAIGLSFNHTISFNQTKVITLFRQLTDTLLF